MNVCTKPHQTTLNLCIKPSISLFSNIEPDKTRLSHDIPILIVYSYTLNLHFPMVFLWFSHDFPPKKETRRSHGEMLWLRCRLAGPRPRDHWSAAPADYLAVRRRARSTKKRSGNVFGKWLIWFEIDSLCDCLSYGCSRDVTIW